MQIITTEYKGPTDFTGSRIRVRSWLKSATIPYNHTLNTPDNHKEAAQQLVNRMNDDRLSKDNDLMWSIVAGGELPCSKGYGFVIELQEVVK